MTTAADVGVSLSAWSTTGLVPGLQIRMPSKELADHLRSRATYHAGRKKEKEPLLESAMKIQKAMEESNEAAAAAITHLNKTSNYRFDPKTSVEQLASDIRDHHSKLVAFAWLADHLFPQDYCLSREDLYALEVLKRW